MLSIDRSHYSAAGSLLVWRKHKTENILYLDCIASGANVTLYEVIFTDAASFALSPSYLEVIDGDNVLRVCMHGENGTVISGKGELLLNSPDRGRVYNASYIVNTGGYIKICECAVGGFNYFRIVKGNVVPSAEKELGEVRYKRIGIKAEPDSDGEFEFILEHTESDIPALPAIGFAECAAGLGAEFERWARSLGCENEYGTEHAYVLWSNTVGKTVNYPDGGIVMSKSGMANVWSWDNCFNALDLAKTHPRFAMAQFMLPYLHLDSNGRAPDSVPPVGRIQRMFVKPPVQGFIYGLMMERNEYFRCVTAISEVYYPMKRNTDWWLNIRGSVPAYHHGNDSGADNSTAFDSGIHIKTPELAAFLSVQCELLSDMAKCLGMASDSDIYRSHAGRLCECANRDFFDGRLFVTNEETKARHYSASLLPLRAIVLGDRLDGKVKEYIIGEVRSHFVCPCGISSEAHDSPMFCSDGYWRGAAWGPDQVFFTLMLRKLGETELADKIADGYKRALEANGFSENHDPISGKGQRCRAYTWSANAYNII